MEFYLYTVNPGNRYGNPNNGLPYVLGGGPLADGFGNVVSQGDNLQLGQGRNYLRRQAIEIMNKHE